MVRIQYGLFRVDKTVAVIVVPKEFHGDLNQAVDLGWFLCVLLRGRNAVVMYKDDNCDPVVAEETYSGDPSDVAVQIMMKIDEIVDNLDEILERYNGP